MSSASLDCLQKVRKEPNKLMDCGEMVLGAVFLWLPPHTDMEEDMTHTQENKTM